jgi:hypothetical protein
MGGGTFHEILLFLLEAQLARAGAHTNKVKGMKQDNRETNKMCYGLMRALTGLSKPISSLSVTIASTTSKIRVPFAIVTRSML